MKQKTVAEAIEWQKATSEILVSADAVNTCIYGALKDTAPLQAILLIGLIRAYLSEIEAVTTAKLRGK